MSTINFSVFREQLDRARHAKTSKEEQDAFVTLSKMVTKENVLSCDENNHGVMWHISGGCSSDHVVDFVLIALFLVRGATFEQESAKHGLTPLHVAAWYGKHRTVRMLLDLGVPRDILDVNKHTPLHWASNQKNEECCKVLVDAGATLMTKQRHCSVLYDDDFVRSREHARVAARAILALKRCNSRVMRNTYNGPNVLRIIARCVWQTRGQEEWIATAQKKNKN